MLFHAEHLIQYDISNEQISYNSNHHHHHRQRHHSKELDLVHMLYEVNVMCTLMH